MRSVVLGGWGGGSTIAKSEEVCSELFGALLLFELFSFDAIRRKMEMAKEMEMDRGEDRDS